MCLILTFIAAIISTALYFLCPKFSNRFSLEYLTLMYWGASLMWSVDGFFRLIEGEAFFDLSMNDTLLGLLIIVCGLFFVAVRGKIHKKAKS